MHYHDGHVQSFSVRIPTSTRAAATLLAKQQGVSLNYFITRALIERLTRLQISHPELTSHDGTQSAEQDLGRRVAIHLLS